jgi:hypothetical protein
MEHRFVGSVVFSSDPNVQRNLRLGRFWIPVRDIIVVAAVVALGVAAKPAYRAYRSHRTEQNLKAALAAASHEDWTTARDKAHSVLMAQPGCFDAIRVWTRALGKLAEPRAFVAASALFSDPRATREDRLETLQTLAVQAPHAMALRAYANLPTDLRGQADFRAAITPLLVRRGEGALAEKNLRTVLGPSDGPKVRLELLRTLCDRPDVWRMAEARRIFADLIAANADKEALAGLLLLGDIPHALAPGLALPDLPTWLRSQPQATAIHHLTALQPALESRPESAEQICAAAIARFLPTEPAVLGTWLARHNRADQAAAILAKPAQTRVDAFLALLPILETLRHDAALKAALDTPPAAVEMVDLEIANALLAWLQGQPATADAALARAMDRAVFDTKRNRFLEIAVIAQRHGATGSAINAAVAGIRLGWGPLPLYKDLAPIIAGLMSRGRSEDLLAVCRTLMRFEPRNPDLVNNFNYLALLHGILPPDKVAAAQKNLIADFPNRREFNATLMLAEILAGKPAEANNRMPALRDCSGVDPLMKVALEGCARTLAGDTEAGTALLKKVDWSRLMRQESTVLRNVLVKFKVAAIPIPEFKAAPADTDSAPPPAWRKAVERLEQDRAAEVLPALPAPRISGAELPD